MFESKPALPAITVSALLSGDSSVSAYCPSSPTRHPGGRTNAKNFPCPMRNSPLGGEPLAPPPPSRTTGLTGTNVAGNDAVCGDGRLACCCCEAACWPCGEVGRPAIFHASMPPRYHKTFV